MAAARPLGRLGEGVTRAHAERRRDRTSTAPRANKALHLQIDRLILHGVPRSEARRLAEAMEHEFASLAGQPGTHFSPLAAEIVPTPPITAGRIPENTGRAAAAAVWSSIASGAPR